MRARLMTPSCARVKLRMRRKLRADTVLGILALLLFIVLVVARTANEHAQPPSTTSSYDTGRYGYRAFYDLLRESGVSVTRFERNHHFLDAKIATLVLTQTPSDAAGGQYPAISRNEFVAIKDWISRGGRLIELAPPYGSDFDTLLGIPSSRTMKNASREASPFAAFPVLHGVRAVRATFDEQFPWSGSVKALPLLVTGQGVVALQYQLGKGTVIALTDPGIFTNERLTSAENARFGVQLIRAHPGVVAFDETSHGYIQNQSLWDALPAPVHTGVWVLAALFLLAIIGSLIRFAPPVAPDRPDERDSSAYITSMANLLARARASRTVLRDGADASLRAVRRSLGLSERTPIKTVLARLQNVQQRNAVLELDRLRDVESPSDGELVRAGAIAAQLRKDFGV